VNFPFNPEIVKIAADEFASGADIDVLLQSQVAAPIVNDGRVEGVVLQNVSGRTALGAKFVVDATGDGVIASAAGVPLADVEFDNHKKQPCTLVFRLSNIDVKRFRALPREKKREIAVEGVKRGDLPWESLSFCSTPGGADAISLMSRLHGVDALNAIEVSQAIMNGRQQIKRLLPFLRESVPGFENAVLSSIAEQLGVRETRRIVGRYTLCEDDIVANRRFEDSIALGAGPVDVHHENGTGVHLWMPEKPFEIPLRTMLPEHVQGLVVTGRTISATREANGGARHMATAMALGEAAGVYAALSAQSGAEASAKAVRAVLRSRGAFISEEDAIVLSQSEAAAIPPI
jgi:hypothetical protein